MRGFGVFVYYGGEMVLEDGNVEGRGLGKCIKIGSFRDLGGW